MKMSVVMTPMTVIPTPTAQTPMVASHVLANLALLAPEQIVLVGKDPAFFISILSFTLILNFDCVLCTSRCR